jgi:fermentation-respiration switch protein FrsA (DUF1100 family)
VHEAGGERAVSATLARLGRKTWPKLLASLILAPFIGLIMLRWFEHLQVYQPSAGHWTTGAALGRPWEEVTVRTSDGVTLDAWFFPATPGASRARLAVLICHGNGGNLSHRVGLYEAVLGTGVNVFAFDYRGYGHSSGRPSEAGTYLDAEAAYQWLRNRGFGPDRIIALGESLGGGVASELAGRVPLGALILQSTFTSIPDIGAEIFPWLPVRRLATIRYDTLSKLPKLRLPLLIMHGRADRIVPFHHGQRLFAAAQEPKCFHELNGDHNDTLEVDRAGYVAGVEKLLRLLKEPQ